MLVAFIVVSAFWQNDLIAICDGRSKDCAIRRRTPGRGHGICDEMCPHTCLVSKNEKLTTGMVRYPITTKSAKNVVEKASGNKRGECRSCLHVSVSRAD
jgi:hypothetical protein